MAAGAGALLLLAGYLLNRPGALRSYLFAWLFFTGLGIGSLGILLLHHTVGGKWGVAARRVCEAGAATLPYMGALLIPVLVHIPALYVWATPEAAQDHAVHAKAAYLNVPFFVIRAILYFAVFLLYTRLLTGASRLQEETGDERLIARMRRISAPGLAVYVVVATFAFVDWVMSLEPQWFSTIFGAMFLVGQVLSALALAIAVIAALRHTPPLQDHLTPQHFHDLGNLLFAFTMLWAYLSFSQYLIIWAGNLPEEIPWYLSRLSGGWGAVAVVLVMFHFAVPFLLLLQRGIKRRPDLLLKIAACMLVVRAVDVYWVVTPSFYGQHLTIAWTDFAAMLALGGAWLTVFLRQVRLYPLLPLRDPRLAGAPMHKWW
jgi:hypothetical protein